MSHDHDEHREKLESKLKSFFEESTVCRNAAKPLKESALIELIVDGEPFTFCKKGSANSLTSGAPDRPDVVFTLTEKALDEILALNSDSSVNYAKLIFGQITSEDASRKVRIASRMGPLAFISKGFMGILTQEGLAMTKLLAEYGLSNVSKIKDALKKIKEDSPG